MRKNVAKSITSLVAVTACFLSLITASVAWFEPNTDVRLDSGSGSTAASYFESGSGTKADPYIISNQVHLYNLAWLQYLGQFNKSTTQTYFKLKNSIDMDSFGSALPPIGTEDMPFIGIFDGGGYTVSNLTVSNDESDLKKKPSTVGTVTGCSVVGFFGIVGDPANLGITSKDKLVYSSLTVSPSISNFYLENVAVESTTANTLIGVVAGYVGKYKDGDDGICSVSDIGVKNGSIEVANGATGLNDTYKETISKFSLIGDTEDTNWTTAYASGGGSSGGTDNDWGGSIDFQSLNQRLTYIMANSTKSSYSYKSSAFNTNIYYTSSTAFNVTTQSLQSAILNSGTYLPLNVDASTITEANYKSASSETVLKTNTGYIVGEGSNSNGYIRAMHNKTNKDNSVVNCSFYTLNSSADSPSRTDSLASSNISFLWLTNDGKTYRIRDNDNKDNVGSYTIPSKYSTTYSSGTYAGIMNSSASDTSYTGLNLVKYNDVKNNFISSLTAATTETFYGTSCYLALNYLQLKTKTEPTATTYSNVTLNGTTGSYDLFSGGINYTLKQDGYMSMLCGMSYQGGGEKGNLPDIYYVDSSSGSKALKKIYKIIKKNGKTAFKFDDSSLSSDETLIFDLNKMSTGTLMEIGGIYYFEFPMIAGDYFMTRYDSTAKVYVPYIYYLDIGANASGSGGGTSGSYTLNNVRYVDVIDDKKDYSGYADILFVISTAAAAGDSKIYFKRDSATRLYYYVGDGTNITVTMLKLKDASSENNVSAIWPSSSSDSSSSAS